MFESRVGETFLLGASTWRIEEITHDRVLVSPAPGEPGKMPFWKADAAGRPLELGRHIGELVRTLRHMPPPARSSGSSRHHDLDQQAAENLVRYLADQAAAAGAVPDDRTILIERCRDELGDWRICVLTPFGGRIHAPWAMAVVERARAETGLDVETMWTDDGFVVRFPETEEPPDPRLMVPVVRGSRSARRAAARRDGALRREVPRGRGARAAAAEAPARRPQPAVAAAETRRRSARRSRRGSDRFRCCSRRIASACATSSTCRRSSTRCGGSSEREIKTVTVDSTMPSPFAAALLFGYVANYIYDGDAPLAERRAQALSIDQAQLRELLGEAELRELLDADALADVERAAAAARAGASRAVGRRRPRSAAAARRSDADGDRGAQPRSTRRRARRAVRAARAITVNIGGEPASSGRIRRPLSRCARRAAAGGLPESLLAAVAARRAGSRAPLRAHARAVHDDGVRGAIRASAARPRRPC